MKENLLRDKKREAQRIMRESKDQVEKEFGKQSNENWGDRKKLFWNE